MAGEVATDGWYLPHTVTTYDAAGTGIMKQSVTTLPTARPSTWVEQYSILPVRRSRKRHLGSKLTRERIDHIHHSLRPWKRILGPPPLAPNANSNVPSCIKARSSASFNISFLTLKSRMKKRSKSGFSGVLFWGGFFDIR